jgi:ammonia channel protein AmtB
MENLGSGGNVRQNKDAKLLYKINSNLLLMEIVWTRYSHELMNSKEQFFTDTYNMLHINTWLNYYDLYQLTKNLFI